MTPSAAAARQEIALGLQSAILHSASFSSIATDAKGVIQIFNLGAERMLGFASTEVIDQITPADISDPGELLARAQALSSELGTRIEPGFEALVFKASRGIEDIYELTYIRKDGSRLPAVVSVTALRDALGEVIGYLLIGTDNTLRHRLEADQKRLDQQLRDQQLALIETNEALQSAKLVAERASLAKSEFLSSMSHELRSPMNAILGFAQLMESSSPPPSAPQRQSIGEILKAGWYLLELINEILDLALIESGKLSLSTETVSLQEVLLDCRGMIEPLARKGGIGLDFASLEDECHVRADRIRIKQVLINLLTNAIKYNRAGGSVEVTCSARGLHHTRISVRDTGAGLPPEKILQLFQPFNRLGQETGLEEGTGIGLVVSKRLVELMGGSIGVSSTVGTGSTFWIELQTASGISLIAPPAAEVPRSGPPDGRLAPARTLLCVEDNPANLKLVERLIERRPDIRLLEERNGMNGIATARSAQPDVILMDINLPGISGLVALGLLAEDPQTAHIPVIALSANAMPGDIERGLAAGFFQYLTKPIRVPEFMETLDAALTFAFEHPRAVPVARATGAVGATRAVGATHAADAAGVPS